MSAKTPAKKITDWVKLLLTGLAALIITLFIGAPRLSLSTLDSWVEPGMEKFAGTEVPTAKLPPPEGSGAPPVPGREDPPEASPGTVAASIERGRVDLKKVAVTFDGGGDRGHTVDILKILEEKEARVTMFLTGQFIRRYPDLVRKILEDGHEIGNHTYHHPHLTSFQKTGKQLTLPRVDRKYLREELRRTAEAFEEVTGEVLAPLWRAPYGEVNREILRWGHQEGYTHTSWTRNHRQRESLDTLDWVWDKKSKMYLSSEEIKNKILRFGEGNGGLNGGIILMHLTSQRKNDPGHVRLGEIVDTIREKGYCIVKVSELVRDGQRGRGEAFSRMNLESGAPQRPSSKSTGLKLP